MRDTDRDLSRLDDKKLNRKRERETFDDETCDVCGCESIVYTTWFTRYCNVCRGSKEAAEAYEKRLTELAEANRKGNLLELADSERKRLQEDK